MSIKEQLNEIIAQTDNGEKWMILSKDGKLHELSEGKEGLPKKIDSSSMKKDISLSIWDKERISFDDLRELQEDVNNIIKYYINNASPASKKKLQELL